MVSVTRGTSRDRIARTARMGSPIRGRQSGKVDSMSTTVAVPSAVQPLSAVPVTTYINTSAAVVDGSDPDRCDGPHPATGYAVDVTVTFTGDIIGGETRCVIAGVPGTTEGVLVPFFVSSIEGTFHGNVTVEFATTGQVIANRPFEIVVDEDAPAGPYGPECVNTPDCPVDQVCRNGECRDPPTSGGPLLPCFLDPNRGCATPETIAWAFAGLLVASVALR